MPTPKSANVAGPWHADDAASAITAVPGIAVLTATANVATTAAKATLS
jgi:hypothetical protein